MPQTGRTKEPRGDTLKMGGGKLRRFRRSVSEVLGCKLHFAEPLRQFRVGLVRRCYLARQITWRGAAHTKWKNRFARYPVQKQRVCVFGGHRDHVHPLAVTS